MREKAPDLQRLHAADSGICSDCRRRVLYCFLSLSVSVFSHILNSIPAKSDDYVRVMPQVAMLDPEQQQTLDAHNSERQNFSVFGVDPLQWSPELAQWAQQQGCSVLISD
jgi:hypothetical protein